MAVRRDLYAVQQFQDVGETEGAWVTKLITKNKGFAQDLARDIRCNHRRTFPLVKPKIVHPTQFMVDAFTAAGNEVF